MVKRPILVCTRMRRSENSKGQALQGAQKCPNPSSRKTEASLHFTSSETCDAESSTIKILPHPSPFQRKFQDGCPQRSADMRAPLAPIQARTRKPASQRASRLEVNAKSLKRLRSGLCQVVGIVAFRRTGRQPAKHLEAI